MITIESQSLHDDPHYKLGQLIGVMKQLRINLEMIGESGGPKVGHLVRDSIREIDRALGSVG